MTLTKVFCASLLALVLLGNAGCGQKGPLTLPTASAI
jgi:predicted small lipoprotein YifL